MCYAISFGRNYSSSNRYNIVEKCPASLQHSKSEVKRGIDNRVSPEDCMLEFKSIFLFLSLASRSFFEEALDAIPQPVNKEDRMRIDSLLSKVAMCMRLQLSCLTSEVTENVRYLMADPERVTTV